MSRIQKALQKIKDQRSHSSAGMGKSKSALEGIQYTDTKVITSDFTRLVKNRVLAASDSDPRSQIFKTLRTRVVKAMREHDWVSLGVTSTVQGEGKSMLASNLAVALSMEMNQSVLLVDLDFKNPSIAKYFDLDISAGLFEHIEGKAALKDVLVNPGFERLVILPIAHAISQSAETLSAPKMSALMEEIKSRYKSRIVICDLPPVLPTDDVLAASSYVDCALLVVEDGKNSEASVRQCMAMLQHTQLLGAVLNKASQPQGLSDYLAGY